MFLFALSEFDLDSNKFRVPTSGGLSQRKCASRHCKLSMGYQYCGCGRPIGVDRGTWVLTHVLPHLIANAEIML